MRNRTRVVVCAWLLGIRIAVAAPPAHAANGDCAQPQTNGTQPTASDCLAILSVAVGVRTCDPFAPCVCAPKGTLPTTATDALVCLAVAVGGGGTLACPCGTPTTTPTVATTSTVTTTTVPTTTSTTTTTLPADFDVDGDGWTSLDGDCCEAPSDGCTVPILANPGAFDFVGDGFDDDCNGSADDGGVACDQALASNSTDAVDYAKALGLCATTIESPPVSQARFGLISATLTLADGTGSAAGASHAIRPAFGGVAVQEGSSMVVLSTGNAAAPAQTNPSFSAFEPGTIAGTSSAEPADWLAANGGNVPTVPGCPAASDTTARDPVMLTLRVRVPTNAQSFRLSGNFLTAEFPEWVCTAFNDWLVVLLDSAADGNPADKNLAVYESPGNGSYPVGANLATGDTGLFRQCRNGIIGCSGATASSISTCAATTELVGSGFDQPSTGCQQDDTVGGGTGWLAIRGNVIPGEVMVLRIAIWDTGDSAYDSLFVLDDLQWSADPVTAGAGL